MSRPIEELQSLATSSEDFELIEAYQQGVADLAEIFKRIQAIKREMREQGW